MVFKYQDVPIHCSVITMKDMEDDGEKGLYGSYFTGKIINPHLFLYGDSESKNEALCHAGKFIGPLAGYLGKLIQGNLYSPSQITALVFIAYFSIGPSFDQIFLGYFVSPEFKNIWGCLCEQTILMLKTAGAVRPIGGNKYKFTQRFKDYKSFHFERMKVAARHWGYGAVYHRDYKFPDWIFDKAEKKMKKADPSGQKYKEMVEFLKKNSGLTDIYV